MDATLNYTLDMSWAEKAQGASDQITMYYALDVATTYVKIVRDLISVEGRGIPSSPGQPPRKQTGALLASIRILKFVFSSTGVEISVGADPSQPGARYSAFLEYGTRKMLPRPYMSIARRRLSSMLTTLANLEGHDYERVWSAAMQQTNLDYPFIQVMDFAGERALKRRIGTNFRAGHGFRKYYKG